MMPTEQPTRPKILLIAYACEPNASSEPGVGWNFAREIATFADVEVITRTNNRSLIEADLRANPSMQAHVSWHYVDLPRFFTVLKKRIPRGIQMYYILWQWKSYLAARRLTRTTDFDLVHHLTFGVTWLAPVACLLPGRFVWGPIGGSDFVPAIFSRRESRSARSAEFIYRLLAHWAVRISPINWLARRRATAILFRSSTVNTSFPATRTTHRYTVCETAASHIPQHKYTARNHDESFLQAVCVGRLQYWKGFRYAIEGFAHYLDQGGKGELLILGDGLERALLESTRQRSGHTEHIKLLGKVPHKQVQAVLSSASVLLHPSFRDGGSWSVMEAMSHELPVIGLQASGVADMVDEYSGILIEPHTPEQTATDIGDALMKLSSDPELRRKLGQGARNRMETGYLWDQRRKELLEIYRKALPHSYLDQS